MLPVDLWLRWKRTLQVVLPVLLTLDMVHSMHYVATLYRERLKVRYFAYFCKYEITAKPVPVFWQKAGTLTSLGHATGMGTRRIC